jgi:hypothetical protein
VSAPRHGGSYLLRLSGRTAALAEGEAFYLRIDVPGFPHGTDQQMGKLYLHAQGDDRPVAEIPDVELPRGLNTWGGSPS